MYDPIIIRDGVVCTPQGAALLDEHPDFIKKYWQPSQEREGPYIFINGPNGANFFEKQPRPEGSESPGVSELFRMLQTADELEERGFDRGRIPIPYLATKDRILVEALKYNAEFERSPYKDEVGEDDFGALWDLRLTGMNFEAIPQPNGELVILDLHTGIEDRRFDQMKALDLTQLRY